VSRAPDKEHQERKEHQGQKVDIDVSTHHSTAFPNRDLPLFRGSQGSSFSSRANCLPITGEWEKTGDFTNMGRKAQICVMRAPMECCFGPGRLGNNSLGESCIPRKRQLGLAEYLVRVRNRKLVIAVRWKDARTKMAQKNSGNAETE